MKRIKKNSLALKVLKGIGYAGLFLLAGTNPYFGLNLLKGFKGKNHKQKTRNYYVIKYLNKRGYVKFVKLNDERIKIELTKEGDKILKYLDIENMTLADDKFDGKWRLVIYDVPNTKSKNRLAFTEKLKNMKFIMVQKSVWATPYDCKGEIMILRKFYEIERHVTYVEVSDSEDVGSWRTKFMNQNGDVN